MRFITFLLLGALMVGALAFTSGAVGGFTGSGVEAISATEGVFGGSGIEAVAEGVTLIKTGLIGRKLVFSDIDFKSAFAKDDFDNIVVTSLPSSTSGTLMLAGRRVREGQKINRRNIPAMVFIPASKEVTEGSFLFRLDGGVECLCEMRFIDRINYSPKIEDANMTGALITTQRDIGVYGNIKAEDPEGDSLEYMVVAYPKSGYVTLLDGGKYRYTPKSGFTGYDSFAVVVRDEYGNWSLPTRVNVKTVERMSEIVYRDLDGSEEYCAAVAMTALGVMSPRQLGDDFYFDSSEKVSREEFVAMALKARGVLPNDANTFFDDDSEINASTKGYISAAAEKGIVDGEYTGTELLFMPQRTIRLYEAATMISKLLGQEDNEASEYSELLNIPIWARGAVEKMITLGIVDEGIDAASELTRGDVAMLLYNMVNNC